MKTAFKTDLRSKSFCSYKRSAYLREKEISVVNFKFYQKLIVVLISFSTILIFPDSPRELANICESYNTKDSCNIL